MDKESNVPSCNMKTKLVLAIAAIVLFGCRKTLNESPNGVVVSAKIEIKKINNPAVLAARVNNSKQGVVLMEQANKSGKGTSTTIAQNFIFELTSSSSAPTVNGFPTMASCVQGWLSTGTYQRSYAGYRRKNGAFAGAIEVYNTSDPYAVSIQDFYEFPHTDIYSLETNSNRLFFTGSTNLSVYPDLPSAAVFGYFTTDASGNIITNPAIFSMPGDIAYDVDIYNNKAFIVTGPSQFSGNTESKLVVFDLTTDTILQTYTHEDLRSVSVNKAGYPYMAVLSGKHGIYKYDAQNMNFQSIINIPTDIAYAQRKIDYYGNIAVAAGRSGMKVFNGNTDAAIDEINVPYASPYDNPDLLATFAVENYYGSDLLIANGKAGLYWAKNTNPLLLYGTLKPDDMEAYDVKVVGGNSVMVATADGVKIFTLTGNVKTYPGSCNGAPVYSGGKDFLVTQGQNITYGGNLGVETFHVDGIYKNCGSIASSKNFTVSKTGNVEIYGNLIHGFTNSYFYLSVEPGATLKVDGDMRVYGDLMLEGTIEFLGNNRKLIVYGNVYKAPGYSITGNFTDVNNKLSETEATLMLNGTDKNPTTTHGVLAYKAAAGAGSKITFTPIFPRNVNYMQTMLLKENGSVMVTMEYAPAYAGKSFSYYKADGSVVSGNFSPVVNF